MNKLRAIGLLLGVCTLIAGLFINVSLAAATSSPGSDGTPGSIGTLGGSTSPSFAARAKTPPNPTGGALAPLYSSVLNGGYVAAGVGMRNLGHGSIDLTTVPSGSKVVAAYLLWDVLDNTASAADATGMLNGRAVSGTLVGSGSSPCWSAGANYSYEAKVTSRVKGNGVYALTGFSSGQTDGTDPWSESVVPMMEGASLVVVFSNSSYPTTAVDLADGDQETEGAQLEATFNFPGFVVATAPSAETTFIVGDGQSAPDGPATFDGAALSPGDFQGTDPTAVGNYSQGNLWDTNSYNVSGDVSSGNSSANATIIGTGDCLLWVGQVLSVNVSPVTTSPNYSGVVSTNGGPYPGVQGEFTVPSATCASSGTQTVSIWVGLGGWVPQDAKALVQNGVDVECQKGKLYTYAWVDSSPNVGFDCLADLYQQQLHPQDHANCLNLNGYTVYPGDDMYVGSAVSGMTAVYDFVDYTQGWTDSFSTPIGEGVPQASGECIVEAPAVSGAKKALFRMPDFGIVPFTSCETLGTIDCNLPAAVGCTYGTTASLVTMQDGNATRATPLWPTSDGSAFDVLWGPS